VLEKNSTFLRSDIISYHFKWFGGRYIQLLETISLNSFLHDLLGSLKVIVNGKSKENIWIPINVLRPYFVPFPSYGEILIENCELFSH